FSRAGRAEAAKDPGGYDHGIGIHSIAGSIGWGHEGSLLLQEVPGDDAGVSVVAVVHAVAAHDLLEGAQANGLGALVSGGLEGGQENRDQEGDNGDDDQQFDESEGLRLANRLAPEHSVYSLRARRLSQVAGLPAGGNTRA